MARGTWVLACRSDCLPGGYSWESGGFDEATARGLAAMLPQYGAEVTRVFDGAAEAKEKFPPGTRVLAHRKHWGAPLGTVEDGGYAPDGQGRGQQFFSMTGT